MTERKTDRPGFFKVRDGIVINKDNDALLAYKKKKANSKRIEKIELEVKEIKDGLEEIKNMLKGMNK